MIRSGKYEQVRFRNTILICPIINDTPHVLIKNIIEDIGINYSSAITGLKNHHKLSNFIAEWHSKLDNLQGYQYLTLPILKVAPWLYHIIFK